MEKSKVYFTRNITSENVLKMYKVLNIELQGRVCVKVHSGEAGNQNYLKPLFFKDVIDYVNEYQYSFRERPFSEVDSLVLSQIVYFKMKGLIPTLERQEDFVPFSILMEEKNQSNIYLINTMTGSMNKIFTAKDLEEVDKFNNITAI